MDAIEQLSALRKQLESANETLKQDMAAWERKEYEAVKADYEKQIATLEVLIEKYKEIFEEYERCKDERYFYNNYWTVNGQKVSPISKETWDEIKATITQ